MLYVKKFEDICAAARGEASLKRAIIAKSGMRIL